MYLFSKRADEIAKEDIERLLVSSIPESKDLDYKRDLIFGGDNDRKEFLFDITAMANTNGGCIIFGIDEALDSSGKGTGLPKEIVGIPIENLDRLILQLEDIIQNSTDPSITNVIFNCVSVNELNVLVIGIPKSLGLPIMVTFKDTNKFYKRRSSGKFPVDVYELNNMFMQNQVLKTAAENFKNTRIKKITDLKVFPLLEVTSSFFLHIVPFNFQDENLINIVDAKNMGIITEMFPIFSNGYEYMYNVDGFATYYSKGQKIISFDQIHRNGIYEVYSGNLFYEHTTTSDKTFTIMNGTDYITEVIKKVESAVSILKKFKVDPPFIISITMLGMKDAFIYNNNSWSQKPFLTNEIYFPSVIIKDNKVNIYEILKPTFDILWQSVGYPKSTDIEV